MSRYAVLAVLVVVLSLLSLPTPSTAVPCGAAGFDLSSLTYADYSYVTNNVGVNQTQYTYYFHPCGNVTYAGCQGLEASYGGSMMCQVPVGANAATTNYSLAVWKPDYTTSGWTPLAQGLGVQWQISDGQGCGSDTGSPRSLTVNFICDTTVQAGLLNFVNLTETSTCVYLATVRTAAVCQAASNAGSTCGYGGLDLSSITGTDLVYQDVAHNYTYYFRPCGTVTSAQCAQNPYGNVAGEAMVCQATGTHGEYDPNTYDLSWWNPTLANWRRFGGGGNGGTWVMDLQDGTTCGGYGARSVQVRYECLANATTPYMYLVNETSTCFYVLYVKTALACFTPPATTVNQCGGAYDLSFLGNNDLIWQDPNNPFIYAFHPCGVVSYQQCQSNPTTNNSMMCQAETGNTMAHNIATYVAASTSYQPTPNGLMMYIQDGDVCGTAPRSLTTYFQCSNTPQNQPLLVSVSEPQTCQYVAYVNTSGVCRRDRQGGICGSQGYDFSLTGNSPDYSWVSTDLQYTYYFRPCQAVIAPACLNSSSTNGAMMCQAVNGQLGGYDIAVYDYNLVSWAKLSNGWQMYVQDGTSCGNFDRALTVNFYCTSGVAYMANLTEVTTCQYLAIVYTPQACSPIGNGGSTGIVATSTGLSVSYEQPAGCGGPYNLNSLATQDLVYNNDPNYNWYLRPCGTVSNANCSGAAASSALGVMLCQASKTNLGGSTAASSYIASSTSYTPIRNGLLMSLTDGAYCSVVGAYRTTNVRFICNSTATTATIYNLTESPTCTYNVWVYTNLVCPAASTSCQGAGYDLSRLNTGADLQLVNASASYNWYFSPCSTVSSAVCQLNEATQASMMCQVAQGSNSSYDIAIYNPSSITWTAINGGVQWLVQDGATCNNYDFERQLTINFMCGGTGGGPGSLVSVVEQTTCNYLATVQLNGPCSNWQTGGGGSSLSGGAIAGIVIGSLVGVVILLGVLLVLCCGIGGRSLSMKKSSYHSEDDGGARSSGKFNDMEASQSNVEMETHSNKGEPSSP